MDVVVSVLGNADGFQNSRSLAAFCLRAGAAWDRRSAFFSYPSIDDCGGGG